MEGMRGGLVSLIAVILGLAAPTTAMSQGPPLPWSTSEDVCEYCLGTVVACIDVPLRREPMASADVTGTVRSGDTTSIAESLYRVLAPETLVFKKRVIYVYPVYAAPDTTVFSPGDTLYVLRHTSEGRDPSWWYRGAPMLGSYLHSRFDASEVTVVGELEWEQWHFVEDAAGEGGWVREEAGVTVVPNHYDPGQCGDPRAIGREHRRKTAKARRGLWKPLEGVS